LPIGKEKVEVEVVDGTIGDAAGAGEVAGGGGGRGVLEPVGGEGVKVGGVDAAIEVGIAEEGEGNDEVVVGA